VGDEIEIIGLLIKNRIIEIVFRWMWREACRNRIGCKNIWVLIGKKSIVKLGAKSY